MTVDSKLPLLDGGVEVPRLALAGAGDDMREAVLTGVRAGYRHVDTAAIYRNEAEVGDVLTF